MSKDSIFVEYKIPSKGELYDIDYAWRIGLLGEGHWTGKSFHGDNTITVTINVKTDLELASVIALQRHVTRVWWWDDIHKRARPVKITRHKAKTIVK